MRMRHKRKREREPASRGKWSDKSKWPALSEKRKVLDGSGRPNWGPSPSLRSPPLPVRFGNLAAKCPKGEVMECWVVHSPPGKARSTPLLARRQERPMAFWPVLQTPKNIARNPRQQTRPKTSLIRHRTSVDSGHCCAILRFRKPLGTCPMLRGGGTLTAEGWDCGGNENQKSGRKLLGTTKTREDRYGARPFSRAIIAVPGFLRSFPSLCVMEVAPALHAKNSERLFLPSTA